MTELRRTTTGSAPGLIVNTAAVRALREGPGPRLRPITNQCTASSCPTIYLDVDSDMLVIQGFEVPRNADGVVDPEGESRVRIPIELLVEAMTSLT